MFTLRASPWFAGALVLAASLGWGNILDSASWDNHVANASASDPLVGSSFPVNTTRSVFGSQGNVTATYSFSNDATQARFRIDTSFDLAPHTGAGEERTVTPLEFTNSQPLYVWSAGGGTGSAGPSETFADDTLQNKNTGSVILNGTAHVTINPGGSGSFLYKSESASVHAIPPGTWQLSEDVRSSAQSASTSELGLKLTSYLLLNLRTTPPPAADFTGDWKVDVTDLGILATNWQRIGDRGQGDANGDFHVDVTDLGILASNWQAGVDNSQSPQSFAEALASVGLTGANLPEPASIGAVMLAGYVCAGRARRMAKQ